jgi:hypothetical protein
MATVLLVCAALFFTLSSCQETPPATLDYERCPVDHGSKRNVIIVGTNATCRCFITGPQNSTAQAKWFNMNNEMVGVENVTDRSSNLTVSYNQAVPNESFECRPITASITNGKVVTYIPQFRCSYQIVNKRHQKNLFHDFPQNVQSLTWQVMSNGVPAGNISTCSVVNNSCTDYMPSLYSGIMIRRENSTALTLKRFNRFQTQFAYITNTGERSCISEIELYARPFYRHCEEKYTNTYVDYTCVLDNVYPGVSGQLSRQEKPFLTTDLVENSCTLGVYGSGKEGDFDATCTWRIKMEGMLLVNHLNVSMIAVVSDPELNSDPDSLGVTDSTTITLKVPEVELPYYSCPLPDKESVSIAVGGTCKCQIKSKWLAPGFARWYTQDNRIVGVENATDMSSTLNLTYNPADNAPTYYCKPITDLRVNVTPIYYRPKFSSSPPAVVTSRLLPLVIIIGVFLTGITSP